MREKQNLGRSQKVLPSSGLEKCLLDAEAAGQEAGS